ncbi:hypothetical protein SAMN05216302_100864 [Nitrosomonas aestuarii]|uniref:Uncharacterized protein n=1 Tax=Nitrosomonas aestuarii TaxID=52441 RepID=A0A1I4A7N3_9PROT|nr:hypothetical protein [Nitrosomonas aestuarii]SFK52365.1 hypothetical protein SAMN05216302_100864 [Nitrosomonas aestuarii]
MKQILQLTLTLAISLYVAVVCAASQQSEIPLQESKSSDSASVQSSQSPKETDSANKKQNADNEKPNMAEYCRKHTC